MAEPPGFRAAPAPAALSGALPRFFILGHSHLGALRAAHAQTQAPQLELASVMLNEPRFAPPIVAQSADPRAAINPAILEELLAAPYDLYISQLGGNDHAILSLLNHVRKFDFVLPEAPDMAIMPAAEILPMALVLDALSERIAPHVRLLTLYRQLVTGPMVHLESPPPLPTAHIEKFPGIFADRLAAMGVSPAPFRTKFWRLQSILYRQACQQLGIHFLPVPRDMCDAQGLLVPEAWSIDPTHGNALYGARVIAKLLDWYNAQQAAP